MGHYSRKSANLNSNKKNGAVKRTEAEDSLCKIRAMLSLSQEQMAKELNVSVHTYRKWENGTKPPDLLPLALKWIALRIMLGCDHRECAVLVVKNMLLENGWDVLSISYFAELLAKACISSSGKETISNNNLDLVDKVDRLWSSSDDKK